MNIFDFIIAFYLGLSLQRQNLVKEKEEKEKEEKDEFTPLGWGVFKFEN